MSNLFTNNRKQTKFRNKKKRSSNWTEYIDFDAPYIEDEKDECDIEFPLEDDIVNLGSWILIYHPNFF